MVDKLSLGNIVINYVFRHTITNSNNRSKLLNSGGGKTALLSSIIGDLLVESSTFDGSMESSLRVEGRLAYVSQTPWIMNATLRENVLFGFPFNAYW